VSVAGDTTVLGRYDEGPDTEALREAGESDDR
jgi:hypothetical protein